MTAFDRRLDQIIDMIWTTICEDKKRLESDDEYIIKASDSMAKIGEALYWLRAAYITDVCAARRDAKIEVLEELKIKHSLCDVFTEDGHWNKYVFVGDIDELIEEVKAE